MSRNINGRVKGTRGQILNILRRSAAASVDDLSGELRLAGATVRRHLDVLLRDDFVAVSQVRGGAGRPRQIFSLTEKGGELFPHHYVRITQRLLEEIMTLTPGDTAERDGNQLAELVFSKMCERLFDEYGSRIIGDRIEDRVALMLTLLEDEGLDFELEHTDGVLRLLGRGLCARIGYGSIGTNGVTHDRKLLERLLGVPVKALPVEEVPHDFLCGFEVGDLTSERIDAVAPAEYH